MSSSEDNCPFANLDPERVLESNEHALTFRDAYPVTELHTLVIPKRRVATYFDLNDEERQSIHELLVSQQAAIRPPIALWKVLTSVGTAERRRGKPSFTRMYI